MRLNDPESASKRHQRSMKCTSSRSLTNRSIRHATKGERQSSANAARDPERLEILEWRRGGLRRHATRVRRLVEGLGDGRGRRRWRNGVALESAMCELASAKKSRNPDSTQLYCQTSSILLLLQGQALCDNDGVRKRETIR